MQRSRSLRQTLLLLFAFLCLVNLVTVVSALPPMADFTLTPTSGSIPLVVQFTNTSVFYSDSKQPITYLWDFGDGGTSNYTNPTHTYTSAGTYIVKLTVSHVFGSPRTTGTTIEVKQTPVFHSNWQYVIVGKTTKQQNVVDAINAGVPKSITFTYNPDMSIDYYHRDWKVWPVASPSVEYGMVIVDSDFIPNLNNGGGGVSKRCYVLRRASDDNWTIGNRIWHEISHSMGLNSDMLNWQTVGNDCDKFCNYVSSYPKWKDDAEIKAYCANKSNDDMTNMVLRAYYTMLWKQAGFPITPTVSTLNVNITTISNYTLSTSG